MPNRLSWSACALVLVSVAACQCDDPARVNGPPDAGPAATPDAGEPDAGGPAFGRLVGIAVEATACDLEAPPKAGVHAAGVDAESDESGRFALENVPNGERVLVDLQGELPPIGEDEYSSGHLFAPVRGGTTYVTVRSLAGSAHVRNFDGSGDPRGITLESEGFQHAIELPGNALVRADGSAYTGDVTLKGFTPLLRRVAGPNDRDVLDFGVLPPLQDGHTGRLLTAHAAAEFRALAQADGSYLQVAPGKTAHLRLQALELGSADAFQVYGWEGANGWVSGPTGTFSTDGDGQAFVEFDAPHLGWWIVAEPVAAEGCVHGFVHDASGAVANTQVTIVDLEAPGSFVVFTNPDGSFCGHARAGAKVSSRVVWAKTGGRGFVVGKASAAGTCGNPAACTDLGTIELSAPPVTGCAKGRLVRDTGAPWTDPVQGTATVFVANEERRAACRVTEPIVLTPDADGRFCAPVTGPTQFEGLDSSCLEPFEAAAPTTAAECAPTGDGCQDLGDKAIGCVR